MNIYEKKTKWKQWLMAAAVLIVGFSLWYTNKLARKIAAQERQKVELIANAYEQVNNAGPETDLNYLFQVIFSNETIPIILTDAGDEPIGFRNLDSLRAEKDAGYLKRELVSMKKNHPPIKIDITEELKQFIYYKDSYLLTQLRYFPFIQFGIIGVFLFVAYLAFSTARKAEQNQVWVGMAKETAHQLGTPISSLNAWIELMKESAGKDPGLNRYIQELGNDISRLELITERFSKIGSAPDLEDHIILEELEKTTGYLRRRVPGTTIFRLAGEGEKIKARINPSLFDWVIENLLKNSIDAMEGKGEITLTVSRTPSSVIIDVKDTGKGLAKAKFSAVFQPGFSTKARGWGLGLSLSKRIIENYHNGRIFVKESGLGKGTTFRIELPA